MNLSTNYTALYQSDSDIKQFLAIMTVVRDEILTECPGLGDLLPNPLQSKTFFDFCTVCKSQRSRLFEGKIEPFTTVNHYFKPWLAEETTRAFRLLNIYYSLPLKYPETPAVFVEQALASYVTDEESYDSTFDPLLAERMRSILTRWLRDLDLSILPCGFGPGVTATTKKTLSEKYDGLKTPSRFRSVVDQRYDIPIETGIEYCRPLAVPKQFDKPRIIGPEPVANHWLQQGLMKVLYRHIKRHPYLRNRLDLSDQKRNQHLACVGSYTGMYATLDLSKASDSLSNELVDYLFCDLPHLLWLLQESRTRYALNPFDDKVLIPLKKFCGMGSGVCFPIESLVFAAALESLVSAPPSPFRPVNWSVFGDDLIVPTSDYENVVTGLGRLGFSVNTSKSFHDYFLESCGKMYYYGTDVTPLYFRIKNCSSKIVTAETYGSWVALANNFYQCDLPKSRRYVLKCLFTKRYRCGQGKTRPVVPLFTTDIADTSAIYSETRSNRRRMKTYHGQSTWIYEEYGTYIAVKGNQGSYQAPTCQPVLDWLANREFHSYPQKFAEESNGFMTQFRKMEGRVVTRWRYVRDEFIDIPSGDQD